MAKTQRTPYVVLGLLGMSGTEPRSGYEIKKVIDTIIAHCWSESHGQLYPVLKQLAAKELICPVAENKGGRKRTRYTLTKKGRSELQSWLASPLEVSRPRDELILRLFFGSETETENLIRLLQEQRERAQFNLDQYREWQEQASAQQERHSLYHLITIRAGMVQAEATVRWTEEAVTLLSTAAKARPKALQSDSPP